MTATREISPVRVIIHLVHGTWGRGFLTTRRERNKRWFEPRSDFRSAITEKNIDLRVEFRPLLWSGRNSVIERDIAAHKLADRIDTIAALEPSAEQIVIAHSHAGNLALRAQSLRKSTKEVKLIAMATPF